MAERRKHKRAPFKSRPGSQPAADRKKAGAARRPGSWGRLARSLAWLLGPPVASALLLTLAFPPAEVSWLAYLALVPLLATAVRARTSRDAFWAALVGGLVFFGLNLYWVEPITTAGYLALVPYMALYWAAGACLVRRLARSAPWLPLAIVAPVVWVALEYLRGWFLSGLPWLFVGHTQYENLVLIQTADLVGAYGATFLCVMTSGLVAGTLVRPLVVPDAPQRRRRLSRTLGLAACLTAAAWAGTVGYGVWRLGQETARPGPVVASIQTCVPQEVKLKARQEQIEELEEGMLRTQLDLTDAALALAKARGQAVDLVVWPETMVPGIMNREYLEADLAVRMRKDEGMRRVFEYLQRRWQAYWTRIRDKAREAGAGILFGAHAVEIEGAVRLPGGGFMTQGPRRNTAFLVSPGSTPYAADHTYSKAHLVPFGEFVPFKQSWPWLHNLLQVFTPYRYDHSLTPGTHDQAPFVLAYDGAEARYQVAICYEDAMAYRVREMARPQADGGPKKAVDFIVNISNDGWFVRGWLAEDGTYELDQHLNLCVFRAVENRVAIVRSVNTGISALISPTGRIEQRVETDGRFRNLAGQIVGRLTLDTRVAPYTEVGDALAAACVVAAAGLVVASVIRNLRQRKEAAA